MSDDLPVAAPLGEAAVLLSWGHAVSASVNAAVQRAAATIREASLPPVTDLVPAYAALAVHYDPLHTDYQDLVARLTSLIREAGAGPAGRIVGAEHEIPVRYDGPDLAEVARQTGLAVREVITRHVARTYRVYLLGFVPGFAYLGDLDPALVIPRRGSPRKRVPAGSVAIAAAQTAIYPLDTPGGWHLIGSTTVSLFDPAREPAALLAAGDRVRFVEQRG